ncbi:accessory gene regulator B [Cohnella sp. OV330]|uniref:accessory gene regulator ArgB-like protein n=1 Tax=Cohnella sp. OV330 TaxID=1855288 RepID=UPI0008F1246B|nr:accessory gene regulator B family protein [Cohnella sp. OV330]SFA91195.1 accessory gene regulator B [Cohnella sp. OV330]
MIATLSARIARSIKDAAPESPQSFEVLKYAVSFLLNAIFIIVLSLIISAFTGRVLETLIALISYAVLRQLSGGLHLKSGMACVVISTAGITAISMLDLNQDWKYILTAVSALLALIYSPSRIGKQTRISKKYYPYLKVASVVLILIGIMVGSSSIIVAFFVQSLTLIRLKGGEDF